MGLKKVLKEVDYYTLKQYGFSVFDKEIQGVLGVDESLSKRCRAVRVLRVMCFVIKDKQLTSHLRDVMLHVRLTH